MGKEVGRGLVAHSASPDEERRPWRETERKKCVMSCRLTPSLPVKRVSVTSSSLSHICVCYLMRDG